MRKGKRKKGERRCQGCQSNSAQGSSDSGPGSAPQQGSSVCACAQSNPALSPQQRCSPKPSSVDIPPQGSGSGAALQHSDVDFTPQAPKSGLSPRGSCQQQLSPGASTQTHFYSSHKQPQADSAPEENLSGGCLERRGSLKAAFPPGGAGAGRERRSG